MVRPKPHPIKRLSSDRGQEKGIDSIQKNRPKATVPFIILFVLPKRTYRNRFVARTRHNALKLHNHQGPTDYVNCHLSCYPTAKKSGSSLSQYLHYHLCQYRSSFSHATKLPCINKQKLMFNVPMINEFGYRCQIGI